MAGIFSKTARPLRPGAYFNFQVAQSEPIIVNTQGIVAVPFTHSWGPSNTVQRLNSFSDFLAIYGQGGTTPPTYTPGYIAVREAFTGDGLPGGGGAAQVVAYRMVGSGGASATKQLSNGTTNAITLTAKYPGTFGNGLSVKVLANATNPTTQHDLVLLQGSVELERFTYAKTDITALAALVNSPVTGTSGGGSNWVTAGSVTSGTALTIVSTASAFTGGNDGSTVASGDWTNAMTALEVQRFSLLAPYDLTDSSVLASMLTWSQGLNQNGKRFLTIVGGAAGESSATAITRAASLNDPNFVTLGVGTYKDAVLGTLSTSQLAPRVAGIFAVKGEAQSVTFGRLVGLDVTVGPTVSDILAGINGGVITIGRDSHPLSPLRLEKGLTTYTTTTDTTRPYNIYSNPKFVRVMHGLETELTEFAEDNVIGRLPVNDATAQFLVGSMSTFLHRREEASVVQPGWTVDRDGTPPPQDTDDFIALLYQITLGRSLEQVLNTVVIS